MRVIFKSQRYYIELTDRQAESFESSAAREARRGEECEAEINPAHNSCSYITPPGNLRGCGFRKHFFDTDLVLRRLLFAAFPGVFQLLRRNVDL